MQYNLIRLNEVKKRTGLSRATIYDLIKKGHFPRQIQLTKRCVAWAEDAIHDWIVQRLEGCVQH
jgi:prophage regulatory protein